MGKWLIRYLSGAGSLVAAIGCHVAHAQDVSASPEAGTAFDRQRTISVSERVQPGYEEVGLRRGGFAIYPRLRAVATYDSNLLARSRGEQGDIGFTLEPSVRAVSNWSRHQLGLSAAAAATRFARFGSENTETFHVRGDGRYDAGDEIRLYGYAGYRRDVERRSAPGALRDSRRPLVYNTSSAGGQLTWQGNRLRLSANASAARIAYGDVTVGSGQVIHSRELDRKTYQGGVRVDYAITPDLAVLVTASLGKIDYNLPAGALTSDRSSRKAEVLGGVSFEFTDLLRGEVAIGYIDQSFTNGGLRGFSGFGGRAQLEYFPTRLTTIRLDASRTLQEAGNPLAPSYRRTRIGLRVDHELFRQVGVSAYADYESNRFQLPFRTERRPHFGLGGQYLVDRHVTLLVRYDYLRVTSRPIGIGRQLTDHVLSIGVLLKP